VRVLALVVVASSLAGCRVLTSGLPASGSAKADAAVGADATATVRPDGSQASLDVGEAPGVAGAGCSDGTREGFRNATNWPDIAGCAGAFDQKGVVGTPDLLPVCQLRAGDTSANPKGTGCNAADLCAPRWHLCRNGADVAKHSPSGDCEGCVPAGEPRFFLVASGASSFGVCSPDTREANDLHGCGELGQPESDGCPPLSRRMGFADCLATHGVWSCGSEEDSLQEASLVTKSETNLGGVLCCKD
jgi:hypothetical protein